METLAKNGLNYIDLKFLSFFFLRLPRIIYNTSFVLQILEFSPVYWS